MAKQELDIEATIPYPPKVMDERTTRVLDTALFQYIARQLWDVKQLLEAERREGLVKEHRFEGVTDEGVIYDVRRDEGVEFHIVDIYNEGDGPLYFQINNRKADEVALSPGQGIGLDHSKAKQRIHWLRFRCATDGETTDVRVIGQY